MIRRVFLAFLVFAVVGCGVDVTDPGSVSGTYTLRTVDGENLPGVLFEIETTFLLEVLEGSITLDEDLTCSISMTFKETEDGTVTTRPETGACTYTLDSGSITLTTPDSDLPPTLNGIISGSTITLTGDDGHVLVFKK